MEVGCLADWVDTVLGLLAYWGEIYSGNQHWEGKRTIQGYDKVSAGVMKSLQTIYGHKNLNLKFNWFTLETNTGRERKQYMDIKKETTSGVVHNVRLY